MSAASLNPTDLYDVRSLLSEEERMVQDTVARFTNERVLPIIGDCFDQGRFPKELVPEMAELGLLGSDFSTSTIRAMCRNIHTLYNFEPEATDEEIRDAALQYVRKISGFTKPSQANEAAFERAVDEVAAASKRLLDSLVTTAAPKDREVEAERARARAAKRYAAA